MDAKTQPAADRVYEDLEPFFEWTRDEGIVTLLVMLPGYRSDQLRVQVTSKLVLRIVGERHIIGNRWRRFSKEFPIPTDCDSEKVSAKFEGGRLFVQFPKLVKPKETTTPKEAPRPEPEAPSQKVDQQQETQGVTPPKPKEEKAEAAVSTNGVSEKTPPQKEEEKEKEKEKKETSDEKEKRKTETAAGGIDQVAQKKVRTNGLTETTEAAPTKAAETSKDAKTVKRSKTRLIDFTQSSRPSDKDYKKEALGDLEAGISKRKKLVNWVVLVLLLVVGLWLLVRSELWSSLEEQKFQEL